MHYCINSLLKNNNEIMQYCIISNDIALIMHYRALLQMPDFEFNFSTTWLFRQIFGVAIRNTYL